ncbi:MAG TPA: ABC transporter substrate-binding protein [Thermoleophilia bacterium]|nr:ABC transporter substrate-binding protein [Thermoleophilia bacterium]HQJ98802.1 ABC transporter substrate-binding protein [Thermoleophilia bacterium]
MRTSSIARRLLAASAVLVVAAVAFALAACGGDGGEGDGGTTSDTPKQGGSLTLSFLAEPSSLDPAIAWNVIDWQIEHEIFEGLLRYTAKPGTAGNKLEPALATEVPSVENGGISEDGLVYTFHLREGVKFQPPVDREVTAADFKYSFERMMSEPRAPATSFYMGVVGADEFMKGKADDISGFKVVDDSTIEITLESPDLSFLNALTMEFCDAVPQEWVKKWGKQINRHPLGTGRFMFDHWTPGQEIVLKRNPNYWEEGRPYLDEIRYALSFNPSTALLKLQQGQIDALGDGLPPSDIVRIQNDPQWKDYVYSQPLIAISYLFLNVGMPPFDNTKVREAIAWAIDRENLVKLQAGQAQPLYQFYPPGLPGHIEGKKYYDYDPEKAKQLLAEAGFPNGFKTMLYTDNVDPNPKLMQSVQADLKAIGIEAELKTMSNNTYYNEQSTPKTLTMGSFGWWMDFPDPSDWIGPLFSKASAVPGGMNSSFWWSQELEDAYVEAQAMTDPEARIAAYSKMQDIIAAETPYAPLYSPIQTTMCSKNVGGFYLHPVYQIDPGSYWRK